MLNSSGMLEVNEYTQILQTLYKKSLILEDMSDFHPILKFWYFDAMAHLDYTISLFAYNADSPRNLLSREYLKYRTNEGLSGDISKYPKFMQWLAAAHPTEYEKFPLFIQKIYSPSDPASYRSFRIALDPDNHQPTSSNILSIMVDELFDKACLALLYNGSTVATALNEYIRTH